MRVGALSGLVAGIVAPARPAGPGAPGHAPAGPGPAGAAAPGDAAPATEASDAGDAPAGAWESWQEFVIANKDALVATARAFCFSLNLPETSADDVFQEACVGLSTAWPRLPEHTRRDPGAYMRGIIYNKARDARNPKRGNDRLNDFAQRVDNGQLATRMDRAAGLAPCGAVDALQRAIDALPSRQREVVVLVKLLDRSIADTAADLGVSGDAVRQSLSRALATLRAELGGVVSGGAR